MCERPKSLWVVDVAEFRYGVSVRRNWSFGVRTIWCHNSRVPYRESSVERVLSNFPDTLTVMLVFTLALVADALVNAFLVT
jgi:hypothetical protein